MSFLSDMVYLNPILNPSPIYLGGGHALSLAEDVVHLSLGKLSQGDGPIIPQTLILSTADPRA